jgi:Undecaprenyl-phosphate galactose phosphotransferase WbaP
MATSVTVSTLEAPETQALRPELVARPFGMVLCLAASDMFSVVFAVLLATLIRNAATGKAHPDVLGLTVVATVFTMCSIVAARLYPGICENPVDEMRRIFLAVTLAFLSLGASTFISRDFPKSRMIVLLAYLLSVLLLPLARSLTRRAFADRSWWGLPVVIMGMGDTGRHVLETLFDHPRSGLKPVAVLDDDPSTYAGHKAGLVAGPLDKCFEVTRASKTSYGIVCMPQLSRHELLSLLDQYGQCFRDVLVIPDLIGMTSLGVTVREFGGILGLEVNHRLLHPLSRRIKRGLDLLITLALAPLICPVVALAALLIKLESKGPMFYADVRVGYRGQRFLAWKLRSMVINGQEDLQRYLDQHPAEKASWQMTQKLKRDPRVTMVGRVIRRTSIDELPQFWNVLLGQMSVVGPRPFLPHQTEMYGKSFDLYKRVRPGITGLWQISGRNHLSFEERARLDAYGIKNWSVWLDVYILFRTITAVVTAKGAY